MHRTSVNKIRCATGEQRIGVAGVLQRRDQFFLEPDALDEAIQKSGARPRAVRVDAIFPLAWHILISYYIKISSQKVTVTAPGPILSGTISTAHAKCGKRTDRVAKVVEIGVGDHLLS